MCELPEKVLGGAIVMPPPSRVPPTPPPPHANTAYGWFYDDVVYP